MIHNLFLKYHVRHKGFSFYGSRKSDEGADTDLIYDFCWPYCPFYFHTVHQTEQLRSGRCLLSHVFTHSTTTLIRYVI